MLRKQVICAFLISLCFFTSVHAEPLGWYSILELGHARTDYTVANQGLILYQNKLLGLATPTTRSNSNGVKIDVGYTFNDFIAAEMGFAKYGKVNFKNVYGISGGNAQLNLSSVDLVGVVKFPIGQFRLDAKLGFAAATTKGSFNSTVKNVNVLGSGAIVLPTLQQRKVRITYGVEAAYDFSEVFGVSVAWQRIPSGSGIQNTDFASIGLVYHFDQFLR